MMEASDSAKEFAAQYCTHMSDGTSSQNKRGCHRCEKLGDSILRVYRVTLGVTDQPKAILQSFIPEREEAQAA